MDKQTALLIIHARLLDTSFRRIAELFGNDGKQETGMKLVSDAVGTLDIDPDIVLGDDFQDRLDNLHRKIG
jgi:hypothetical protein